MNDMYNDGSKSANEIWLFLKSAIHKGVQEHIPNKRSRRRNKHPQIGGELKKLTKQQNRFYKRKKKTKDNTLIQKYRELKKEVQNQQQNAYWRYREEIVTVNENDQTSEGSKKFWTFNKH